MNIATLIVDDEELARDRLRTLLQAHSDVQIVGEAEDGEQALERIEELAPDLVFLDIQMPACGGMEVVQSLRSPRPFVIFCTAFDQYAVDAFELNAVDYLLKPVSRARLASALDRVRQAGPGEVEEKLERAARAAGTAPQRFLGKRGSKFSVIQRRETLYFTSEEGLTKLVTRDHEYWIQPTLNELEKRLGPEFFRVSRAALVNLRAIKEVIPLIGGHGEVALVNGGRLDVSRRRFKSLLERLES